MDTSLDSLKETVEPRWAQFDMERKVEMVERAYSMMQRNASTPSEAQNNV